LAGSAALAAHALRSPYFAGHVFEKTVDKRNHELNAVFGATAPSLYEERERIATVLLANLLAGPGSNSVLNRELREKRGWVYGVEASYTQFRDSGVLAVSLGCDRDNFAACEKVVLRQFALLRERPLTPAALRAAKKQLIGQLSIGAEGGETQCLSMGKSLLAFGSISSDQEDRAKVEAVTADDLQAAARRILSPDSLSKLVFL
ncbi:MAG: insulinase family protein, partial [Bacteroidales bacterium]|nr:insulinase family protein [Bacteroidales bacterium]